MSTPQELKSPEEKSKIFCKKLSWQKLRKLSDVELVQYVLDQDKVIDSCLCYPKEFMDRFLYKKWFKDFCWQAWLTSPVYYQREILQEVIDEIKSGEIK